MRVYDYEFFTQIYFRTIKDEHSTEFARFDDYFEIANTRYSSYCELELINRDTQSAWRDEMSLAWETIVDFFKMFGIKFVPKQLMQRGHFLKNERFVFFNYFEKALIVENSEIQLKSLSTINVDMILYDIYLNIDELVLAKRGHYFAYYYNNLLPENYDETLHDEEVNPFIEQPVKYLETREFGTGAISLLIQDAERKKEL
jgi:hypothetical protein